MKKSVIINSISFVIFTAYIFFLIFGFFGIEIQDVWFSLAILTLSIPLILKGIFFRFDSSLFAGVLLAFCGISGIIQNIYLIDSSMFYPVYVFSIGFASFIVFTVFRQNIHFKIFAIFTFEVLLLVIYKIGYIEKYLFLFLNIVYIIFVLFMLIRRLRKNIRSAKNG